MKVHMFRSCLENLMAYLLVRNNQHLGQAKGDDCESDVRLPNGFYSEVVPFVLL